MVWWIWLIVALVLGLIEVASVTFILMWVSAGAFITALISLLTSNIWVQVAVFVVVSALLLWATRPWARKFRTQRTFPNRLETMMGKVGTVVQESRPGTFATLRIDGELWSAESNDALQAGQQVRVIEARTTVLRVAALPMDEQGGES